MEFDGHYTRTEQWNLCTVYTHPTFTLIPSHPLASLSVNYNIILFLNKKKEVAIITERVILIDLLMANQLNGHL